MMTTNTEVMKMKRTLTYNNIEYFRRNKLDWIQNEIKNVNLGHTILLGQPIDADDDIQIILENKYNKELREEKFNRILK